MGSGMSADRQASKGLGSTSMEMRSIQLTERIQNVLASVRREPLAYKSGQSHQQLPDSMEPETPRHREVLPKLGRTWSPGCPSPVPEPGRAPSRSCQDPRVPAEQLSAEDPVGGSAFLETWHEPTGQLHSGSVSGRRLSGALESYRTAKTLLTSSSSSRSQRAACCDSSITDSSIRMADPSSLSSNRTEAERTLWDDAASSDLEDLSDARNSSDEDSRLDSFDSASSEKDFCVPACHECGPVQLQISIQQAPKGFQQQQQRHVCVRLYVTEVLEGVRYVAPWCSPEPVQEGGSPGDHPLDLEWLRHVHVEQARHYLMDVAGPLPISLVISWAWVNFVSQTWMLQVLYPFV